MLIGSLSDFPGYSCNRAGFSVLSETECMTRSRLFSKTGGEGPSFCSESSRCIPSQRTNGKGRIIDKCEGMPALLFLTVWPSKGHSTEVREFAPGVVVHAGLFPICGLRSLTFSLCTPQTGYSFGTPQADQYAPQVPPPPTTPGTAPLGFAPATTPTQDLSKAPTGQPEYPYSQYGKESLAVTSGLPPLSLPRSPRLSGPPAGCGDGSFCGYVRLQYKQDLVTM